MRFEGDLGKECDTRGGFLKFLVDKVISRRVAVGPSWAVSIDLINRNGTWYMELSPFL